MSTASLQNPASQNRSRESSLFHVLVAISFCHMLNDMVQSLLPSNA